MNKAAKEYTALASQHGFVLVRIKKHQIFKHPNGAMVCCPASPSDSRRGLKQFRKHIKLALSSVSAHQ